MTRRVSEQAVLLGKRQSLVGILTRGVAPAAGDGPAIVILNTGIIHRVGHHRMFVTMSRALAQAGHTVLRFDFSGIGDSDPRDDGLSLLDASMDDIRDALDWLEQDGRASRFILVGLCSGADHALLYGHADDRVVALVLMDPSIPVTFRHYVHFVADRLTRFRSWMRVLTGRSLTLRTWLEQIALSLRPAREPPQATLENLLSRKSLEAHYQKLVDKGIFILAAFTEESTRQTYREQILDALPNVSFGDKLNLEFFRGSDHTFALESDRARLVRLVLDWVGSTRFRSAP